MTRHAARARLLGCITLLALACLVGATSAQADVPGPITTRVMAILNTAGSGTTGMYVKQVGGPVIAAQNENFAFAPASSIIRFGTTCHESPKRSFTHPHGPCSPPSVSASE